MEGKGEEGTHTPPRMKPFGGSAPRDAWFAAICFLSADEYERNEVRTDPFNSIIGIIDRSRELEFGRFPGITLHQPLHLIPS